MQNNTDSVITNYIYMKRINNTEPLGKRIAQIRKARGISQKDVAKTLGISQRMLCYYEKEALHVPAEILPSVAKTLKVTVDELVGLKPTKLEGVQPKHSRVWRKLMVIERFSHHDRKAVLHYINTLSKKYSTIS